LAGIVLRPGNAPAGRGAIGRPRWLLRTRRRAFPRVTLRVRLDGGFAGPTVLAFLDQAGVEDVVGLPGNTRLDKRIRRPLGRARVLFRATGQPTALFGETRYAARRWRRKRRVIMKAEVVQYPGRAPRDNPRFVVTNLTRAPEAVYAIYRQRGDVENRYKELKDSLGLGRTSCPRFLANQGPRPADGDGLHPLPDPAAACPRDGLRRRPGRHAAGTPDQARGLDYPIGARIVLHLPRACPWLEPWRQVAHAVGARAG
jgi:Transposase DDE domain group 1